MGEKAVPAGGARRGDAKPSYPLGHERHNVDADDDAPWRPCRAATAVVRCHAGTPRRHAVMQRAKSHQTRAIHRRPGLLGVVLHCVIINCHVQPARRLPRAAHRLLRAAGKGGKGVSGPSDGHPAASTLSGLLRADVRAGEYRLLLPICADSAAKASACALRELLGLGEHSMQSSRSASASHGSSSGTPKSGTLWHRCGAGERGCGQKADMVNLAPPSQQAVRPRTARPGRRARLISRSGGAHGLAAIGCSGQELRRGLPRRSCGAGAPSLAPLGCQLQIALRSRFGGRLRFATPPSSVGRSPSLARLCWLRSAPTHRGSPMRCGAARGARMR